MRVSHARIEPAGFSVDYRPVREGSDLGHVGLVVRSGLTPMDTLHPLSDTELEALIRDKRIVHGF
ncbi:hypothetical protein AB0D29_16555 [Streptomyces sp. NPDC048424]|uniref:hypothetical protein n=1 Tax=Streptomyces sp. NPDC048424 TaxID=3155265 RepID=UPI00343AA3B0